MNKCKLCGDLFPYEENNGADNICECCFHDQLEGMDLEDKLEVLLK